MGSPVSHAAVFDYMFLCSAMTDLSQLSRPIPVILPARGQRSSQPAISDLRRRLRV